MKVKQGNLRRKTVKLGSHKIVIFEPIVTELDNKRLLCTLIVIGMSRLPADRGSHSLIRVLF